MVVTVWLSGLLFLLSAGGVVAANIGALSEVLKAAIPEILEFMRGKKERPEKGAER
jgi:hypothetical protein